MDVPILDILTCPHPTANTPTADIPAHPDTDRIDEEEGMTPYVLLTEL